MPQKKQVSLAELKVGIFVMVAVLLLSILILQQSWGMHWFSKSAKAMTYLPDVGGLKSGAPVWLAGIEIGRVRKVTIIPPETYSGNARIYGKLSELKKELDSAVQQKAKQNMIDDIQDNIRNLKADVRMVEVQLDIRPQFVNRISKDSEVSIDSKGLIGDSFINISPGTYGETPEKRGEYYVIDSVQRPGFREIMTGANDVVANFGILSDQVKNIITKFNPEKVGVGVGNTLQEMQKTVHHANETFSQATMLLNDLHSGKGTFGKITTDPQLYNRLVESLEKFNKVAENIQSGKGTVGMLINDPSLFNSAAGTLKKAETIMDRIEKGEGTLGKLTSDAELYEKSKKALDSLASLTKEIEEGKGTMGKLLKDPGLYNNLNQSTAEISKLIYDIRKDPKKYLTIRFRVF